MTFLKYLWSKKFAIGFIFLFVAYFLIGVFQINNTGLAGDESAHFAAAQSYITGEGLNVEHPTLLKDLDAIVLKTFFKEYQTKDDQQWSRGINYLIFSGNDSYQALNSVRSVHLVFNAILLLWLVLYTYKWKFLKPEFSLLMGFLYVFSPSFFSHNFLITFDVAGSVTTLCTIISLAYFITKFDQLKTSKVFIKSLIFGLILALALNSKFSNFVLLVIVGLSYGLLFINYYLRQNDKKLIQLGLSIFVISTIVISTIWVLNSYAFWDSYRWSPNYQTLLLNVLFGPFFFYLKGLVMTAGRSEHIQPNFIEDHFQPIHYYEFIGRVFWFKENPVLVLLFLAACFGSVLWLAKNWLSIKWTIKFSWQMLTDFKLLKSKFLIIIWMGFPAIYLSQALNSQLTIGYRHFYPVLIFIYAGIAWFWTNFSLKKLSVIELSKTFRFYLANSVWVILILGYVSFGVAGQSQGISYVNFLWRENKWNLITDSTINWDQDQIHVVKYLTDNNLFSSSESDLLSGQGWNTTFDISGGPNSYLVFTQITGKSTKLKDFWSAFTNLREKRISQIQKKYIVVDSNAFQNLSDDWYKNKNQIAKENLDLLLSKKPIYERNEIVFLYEIN
ncbi:MAG: hypothetical protein WCK98_00255 [bacterium]